MPRLTTTRLRIYRPKRCECLYGGEGEIPEHDEDCIERLKQEAKEAWEELVWEEKDL